MEALVAALEVKEALVPVRLATVDFKEQVTAVAAVVVPLVMAVLALKVPQQQAIGNYNFLRFKQ
jgi:hypothetical protein